MRLVGQRDAPAALPPGKTRYPLYRRLGGPQVRKISPSPGFDPRTVQLAASRYTDSYPGPLQRMGTECYWMLLSKRDRKTQLDGPARIS